MVAGGRRHEHSCLNHAERFVLGAGSHVYQKQANMGHPRLKLYSSF